MNPDPSPFRFKQFEIHQHQSAMKVGTDGVLLGAKTTAKGFKSILDIGCGTGLLSLMLAQKCDAPITAIEIDSKASEQADYNFKQSPWANQFTLINSSLQDFSTACNETFDLILSNPPYFDSKNKKDARAIARNQSTLNFKELIDAAASLLHPNGTFGVIIPFSSMDNFVGDCRSKSLFVNECCIVKGNSKAAAKRSILYFKRIPAATIPTELIIEKEKRHDYTADYLKLVEPYLL